jgi:hypothetical protein
MRAFATAIVNNARFTPAFTLKTHSKNTEKISHAKNPRDYGKHEACVGKFAKCVHRMPCALK